MAKSTPCLVRVLGKEYRTVFGAQLETGVLGEHDQMKGEVRVTGGLPHDEERETLLHELIHAIDEQIGIGLTEKRVRQLSVCIYALVRDNPGLAKYLSAKAGRRK